MIIEPALAAAVKTSLQNAAINIVCYQNYSFSTITLCQAYQTMIVCICGYSMLVYLYETNVTEKQAQSMRPHVLNCCYLLCRQLDVIVIARLSWVERGFLLRRSGHEECEFVSGLCFE